MDVIKQKFVDDMDGYSDLIQSRLGILWRSNIMATLQCDEEQAEKEIMKDPEVLKLIEEGEKRYLTKYGLEAVNPERITITDFDKFRDFISQLSPEPIEDSGPRGKNEFRFLFRNKILIGITNQIGWIGDISVPESIQTNYLLDLFAERPSIREILIEKNLDQDDSFKNIDYMLDIAKKGLLQEFIRLRKKQLISKKGRPPFFYKHNTLEDLYSGFASGNSIEHNREVMLNRINRLEKNLGEIREIIIHLQEKDSEKILIDQISSDYLEFIEEQDALIPSLYIGLEAYPEVAARLRVFHTNIPDLNLED